MANYVRLEYIFYNNPKPSGVQFKGVFGDRSIGKTHGVLNYLCNNIQENESILFLRRNKLEMNFAPFVSKYSAAFNQNWKLEKNTISCDKKVIMYLSALSLAERGKHNNYENPHITNIIIDEVFCEKPNKNEFQEMQTWITTVSRRTGFPFHPITIWLLGNHNYGHSPIMENLGIYASGGKKQKTDNGVYLFSDTPSPKSVINVKNPLIKNIEISKDNFPILSWWFNKIAYGLFDCGAFLYIKEVETASSPFNFDIKCSINTKIILKQRIPPIYVQNYECLRFFSVEKGRIQV